MKSDEKIEIGDRFEARVSKQTVPVVVLAIEDRTSPTKRAVKAYIVKNETTGRKATFKSKRRFLKRLDRKTS